MLFPILHLFTVSKHVSHAFLGNCSFPLILLSQCPFLPEFCLCSQHFEFCLFHTTYSGNGDILRRGGKAGDPTNQSLSTFFITTTIHTMLLHSS